MDDEERVRQPYAVAIIGTGFAGIGMAVALKRQGVQDIVLLERAGDIGGVWRDNTYPGAACDVPSHLYSFSFAPNPDWSHVFSGQAEIHAYLTDIARRFDVLRHVRFHTEVSEAAWDEAGGVWRVRLTGGGMVEASMLITATGQLSRPVVPRLPGAETLSVPSFHSAGWDHDFEVGGKSIAVIGTGASAIQFVPELAKTAASVTLYQRTPPYVIARPDRAYRGFERRLFRTLPWLMKLHRGRIYAQYETRALGFTRFAFLIDLVAGIPFRWRLWRQVRDPALRKKLRPDYKIGCKRILLSDEYYPAVAGERVELVTQPIRRVAGDGIETADGRVRKMDALVYGTGFIATEFLAPMRIVGRGGGELNAAWRDGASAYLGISVPGFPNFFMLYGPNTNLGHSSIIFMLESQIAHIMRVRAAMQREGAAFAEVHAGSHDAFRMRIRRGFARTVWSGCESWYVDENGHSPTNWPGFTLTYRWLTRHAGLAAYRFGREAVRGRGTAAAATFAPPRDVVERVTAQFLRLFLRAAFKPLIGPPFGARSQRALVAGLSQLMPSRIGITRRRRILARGVPTQIVSGGTDGAAGAILYLHGGAFVLGNAASHSSITTRLAKASGMDVWLPEYRLAPEHPFPAAYEDCLACHAEMIRAGIPPERIVIAGDSAGGGLALAVALALRDRGDSMRPAGLALISPVTDPGLTGATLGSHAKSDPMIRKGWLRQGIAAYAAGGDAGHHPLKADLRGLPPMLVQVGDEEILLSDSLRLAERARACGVACSLEIHEARWHVYHLQAFWLRSARSAIGELAAFARARVGEEGPEARKATSAAMA